MDTENKTPDPAQPTPPPAEPTPPIASPTVAPVPTSEPTAAQILPPVAPTEPALANPFVPQTAAATAETLQIASSNGVTGEESGNTLAKAGSAFMIFMGGLFSWIIFPGFIVLILHYFVFQAYHVIGSSMINTLHETDYLIVSKVGYSEALVERMLGRNKPYIPARGQIIVFHYPNYPAKVFVKRVVGLPGDRVVIKNDIVTIFNKAYPNGFNPDKNYEPADAVTLIDTDETIENGFVFVLGDNRNPGGSYDSRDWGQLKSTYIIGNAVLRLLPLDQVKLL